MADNLARASTPSTVLRRPPGGDTLADVLERVLDKGIVIVGDIGVNILDIELLTLRIRLLIASADTAREMGIDWWTGDPFLSSKANAAQSDDGAATSAVDDGQTSDGGSSASSGGADERRLELSDLRDRVAQLEAQLARVANGAPARADTAEGAETRRDRR